MTTKTEIIYLDKYITNHIDSLRDNYINHPRGKIISIALGFYFTQDKETQDKYLEKATNLIKNSSQLELGNTYGTVRKGKIRTNLYLKEELANKFKGHNKKIVVLASLMYVGLIK